MTVKSAPGESRSLPTDELERTPPVLGKQFGVDWRRRSVRSRQRRFENSLPVGQNMANQFGEMRRVDLRQIWLSESRDFSPWLAENIHELGKAIGLELELVEREARVGDFAVDLLAKDLGTDEVAIIENQFGSTNHDHLGKLITYASGFDASTVVWIAEEIREEHRQALDWLNQRTDTETLFFGIVIEVIAIDDSKPAFTFRPVVFPNEWQKSRKRGTSSEVSPRGEAYRAFFQGLVDQLREVHNFTGARVAQPQNWYGFSSGISEAVFGASFAQGGQVRVDLYIDSGDAEVNKAWFDRLFGYKDAIELECGHSLEWERLDDKRASRIAIYTPGSIEDDESSLMNHREWMIENLLKFKEVFGARLVSLQRASD